VARLRLLIGKSLHKKGEIKMNFEEMTTSQLCDEAEHINSVAFYQLCEFDTADKKFRDALISIIEKGPKKEINSYSHVYLYAKHWYKHTDVVADMKILIGKRCGIDVKYISVTDIVGQLTDLVWLSITRSGNPIHFFGEFVLDITIRKNHWKFAGEPDDSDEVVVIKKCLSVLSLTERSHVDGELEEPNPEILPLASEDGLKRFREIQKEVKK